MDREHAGEMTFEVDAGHDESNAISVTSSRERKLLMKVDLCVLPTVIVLYLLCFIDRTNIAGMEEDLKLEGYDYNVVLSAFYVSYIVFEMPATLCCKLIGAHDD
ncbi:hypothetical protein J4E85_004920 [Alternaria conjuncta]|uniref:uncharacterized protein n=1 Tax=Alternaria conjuncta TaxID=181017 RepID=UPI00221F7E2E|nr:uncharacterized protein J4E85_004920 [Alternaria conjuncta]KAI4930294.1 hypothetical protein J4E85_004920 [Alternaria conjuncta]